MSNHDYIKLATSCMDLCDRVAAPQRRKLIELAAAYLREAERILSPMPWRLQNAATTRAVH